MNSNLQTCAELDTYYTCLYDLTRDELRYTLDGIMVNFLSRNLPLFQFHALVCNPCYLDGGQRSSQSVFSHS